MGSLDEISCENPETSFQIPDTSQTYITTDSPFLNLFPLDIKRPHSMESEGSSGS